MREKRLTGFYDIHGTPIREGDVVKYTEDGEDLDFYTVVWSTPDWEIPYWLLVSHEDYEYNEDLGGIPVEIVNTPAGEGEGSE